MLESGWLNYSKGQNCNTTLENRGAEEDDIPDKTFEELLVNANRDDFTDATDFRGGFGSLDGRVSLIVFR